MFKIYVLFLLYFIYKSTKLSITKNVIVCKCNRVIQTLNDLLGSRGFVSRMDRISISSDQFEFFSLSRLHSGPCAVPYPPIIQRHGVGSSESLWASLQPPKLPLCDLNQERDLGRLLRTVRRSPVQLACCNGNHELPVGSGKYDIGRRLSRVYKGSEH